MKILLAPHNDDEALFASYIIQREHPLVIIVTDGARHEQRGIAPTAQRRQESIDAMDIFGVPVMFLGISDNALTYDILFRRLKWFGTEIEKVYAPAIIEDGNPDHNIVGEVAKDLWDHAGHVEFYSTYSIKDLEPRGKTAIIPTPEEEALKEQALSKYISQLRCNGGHFAAVKGKPEYLC